MIENPYYISTRPDVEPYIPQNMKRTLDVGCATGAFSKMLKDKKNVAETWGIEMVEECAREAQTRVNKVLTGTFDDVYTQLPDNYFDCVFFNDVLEHMPKPETCLEIIKGKLSQGGLVIASIPNVRYIEVLKELVLKKDWKYTDSGIMDRTHLRFFTRKSMMRMFDECGYNISSIKGINVVGKRSLTNIINTLFFKKFDDIKYKQYLIVATPK